MSYQSAFPWIVGVLLLASASFVVRAVHEAHKKHKINPVTRVVGGTLLAVGAVALALLFILG